MQIHIQILSLLLRLLISSFPDSFNPSPIIESTPSQNVVLNQHRFLSTTSEQNLPLLIPATTSIITKSSYNSSCFPFAVFDL